MAESLDLTAPDQVKPGTTKYRIRRLNFDVGVVWDEGTNAFVSVPTDSRIVIDLLGEHAIERRESYEGEVADTLIKQINTLNMSTKSMHKRVMERLIADGRLAGTISGTPDSP